MRDSYTTSILKTYQTQASPSHGGTTQVTCVRRPHSGRHHRDEVRIIRLPAEDRRSSSGMGWALGLAASGTVLLGVSLGVVWAHMSRNPQAAAATTVATSTPVTPAAQRALSSEPVETFQLGRLTAIADSLTDVAKTLRTPPQSAPVNPKEVVAPLAVETDKIKASVAGVNTSIASAQSRVGALEKQIKELLELQSEVIKQFAVIDLKLSEKSSSGPSGELQKQASESK